MRCPKLVTNALLVAAAFASAPAFADPQTEVQTVPSILQSMVGCFRVVFNYIEDGAHDAVYAPVLEKAELASSEPFTINRTLIIDGTSQKHWSETWTEVSGRTWRQEVTGPYGDFRYACDGEWQQNQWRCVAEKSPKPRRDAARAYDYLDRENTLQVNDSRWVHVQNNHKRLADGSLYSVEAGWNTYEKVADDLCLVADGG